MKKTMRFLSMAALALVGAMMTGCSSDDNFIDEPQQPENKSNVVTLTTTVGLDGGATTRALTSGGVKTFATGETIALVYKKTGGATAVAVSDALKDDGDIASGAKSATFTFTLEDPDNTKNVTYVYPAAMAKADGTINYDALGAQDGTLASLASSLDLATCTAAWDGGNLPAATLANQLAVCALTIKDNGGTSTITGGLSQVTVSDGTNSYTVSPASGTFGTDVIYVAMKPVTTAAVLSLTATDGTNNYVKYTTSRKYEAGNIYNLGLRMIPGPTRTVDITNSDAFVSSGKHVLVTGTTSQRDIWLEKGATVTLSGVNINRSGPCIYCEGDATIILADGTTNTLTGGMEGIQGGPSGTTLTIMGSTGVLNVSGNWAGIGGENYSESGSKCGNIVIQGGVINATGGNNHPAIGSSDSNGTCGDITITGGTVTATGGKWAAGIGSGSGIGSGYDNSSCGNITISGGTVTATGGENGAGIGCGYYGTCGNITITDGVTSVTAKKNQADINTRDTYSIGNCENKFGTCGTITIGGTVYPDITISPYIYDPIASVVWDFTEIHENHILTYNGYEYKGVTLTGDGYLNYNIESYNNSYDEEFTFTNTLGKKFTSIVITFINDYRNKLEGDGWVVGEFGASWSNASGAESVSFKGQLYYISSIRFVIK